MKSSKLVRAGFLGGRLAVLATLLLGLLSCSADPELAKQEYLERGNDLAAEGKLDEADIQYRKALQQDPEFGEAYYRSGLLALDRKRPDQAFEALRSATTFAPDNLGAKVKLAETCLLLYRLDPRSPQKLLDRAGVVLGELRASGYPGFEAPQLSSLVAIAEKRYADAVIDLQEAERRKPGLPEVALALAKMLFVTRRGEEAERLARAYLLKDPSFGPLYDVLYAHYVSQRKMSDAENILKEKIASNQDEIGPRLQLALHLVRTGRQAEMTNSLQEVLDDPGRFPAARLHVGDFYAAMSRWSEAVALYEAGTRDDEPRRAEYRKRIVRSLLGQGDVEGARRVVGQALEESPDDIQTQALNAILLSAGGTRENLEAAIAEWRKLTEKEPDNAAYWYDLGQAQRAVGRASDAEESFRESIKRNWTFVPSRLAMAELVAQAGRPEDALQVADDVLTLRAGDRQARLIRVAALRETNRELEARSELAGLLAENPSDPTARYEQARLDLDAGRLDDAEGTLRQIYKPGRGDPRVAALLAEVRVARGDPAGARSLLLAEMEERASESPILRQTLGQLAVRAGDMETAIVQFQRIATHDPSSAQAQFLLANVYAAADQLDSALAAARKALELAPEEAGAPLLVATLLDRMGRSDEALPYYRDTVELAPDNPIALNNLAFHTAESGDLDGALELAQRAAKASGSSPIVADTLGWIYLKKGMRDSALQIFERLVEIHPSNSTYRYHFGAALIESGSLEKGRQELVAALEMGTSATEKYEIRLLLERR